VTGGVAAGGSWRRARDACTSRGYGRVPGMPRRGRSHTRAGGWVALVASSARRQTARRQCWSRAVANRGTCGGCVARVRPPQCGLRQQRGCGHRQLPPSVREPSLTRRDTWPPHSRNPIQGKKVPLKHISNLSDGDPLMMTPCITSHNCDLKTSLRLVNPRASFQLRA